jgi:hypothetical protein
MKSFNTETKNKLEHYVYRLVDPRSGLTFYVGKGKDNRVFSHVNSKSVNEVEEILSENEEIENLKLELIKEIHNEGLEVIHIIHRHGMDKKTSYEVEGALIDAYGGLANRVNGHNNNDFGVSNPIELQNRYSLREFNEEDIKKAYIDKFMIIKIRKSTIDSLEGDYESRLYRSTRGDWKVSELKVKAYKYVLSVVEGVVKEVYEVDSWNHIPGKKRMIFTGKIAAPGIAKLFKNFRVPEKYRKKGAASPFHYSR